jgi:hypothetical protein
MPVGLTLRECICCAYNDSVAASSVQEAGTLLPACDMTMFLVWNSVYPF